MNTKTISIAGTCLVPIDPALLKQCPLGEEVDVSAERDALVIRPVRRQPRQGWADALAAVSDHELARDEADLAAFRETPHDWDCRHWEWGSGAGPYSLRGQTPAGAAIGPTRSSHGKDRAGYVTRAF